MAITESSDDLGECVLLPPAVHRIKEANGQNFIEPANANYKDGIYSLNFYIKKKI